MIDLPFYKSNLLPAAPVEHGYKNCWIRDMWYCGLVSPNKIRERIWKGMIDLADKHKWKFEYHAQEPPKEWYSYIHVRYDPQGNEIQNEHWLHNQFDAIANWGEVCLDMDRIDLAELLVKYIWMCKVHRSPTAGMWEDKNVADPYSIACCISFLQRAKIRLPHLNHAIFDMVSVYTTKLYRMLGNAIRYGKADLSLLGIIWPLDLAGPYKEDLIKLVSSKLEREPFGFIRYEGDLYDGEHFNRGLGKETPWPLGDCFMSKIEPDRMRWYNRLNNAYMQYGCTIPELYFPESMKMGRNSPLVWAECMYDSISW